MRQYWQKFATRIDALSLRERAMAFAIAALALVTLVNLLLIDPLLATQNRLSQQVKQEQQQIAALQAEIQARVKAGDADPDAANRLRLQGLRLQAEQLRSELHGVQEGLVSPDRMSALLEDLLRRNGKLRLASLRTLPVAALGQAGTGSAAAAGAAGMPAGQPETRPAGDTQGRQANDTVYKHGVEIILEGSYLDIMQYLTQLEAMPWQLFWAGAELHVDAHPKATLTLNLFTLSLDRKWLHI